MHTDKPRKNLLWDLGNTLIRMNTVALMRRLGLFDCMVYSVLQGIHPEKIFHKAFDLLDLIEVPHAEPCSATAQGRPLPSIVCQWLAGTIDHSQVSAHLKTSLIEQAPEGFFSSEREARLVEIFLKTLTDPQALTATLCTIKEGEELLHECAKQYDEKGEQRHTLFMLSNWDPYSITPMIESLHLQNVFAPFSKRNLVFSGEIGLIKPHDEIYAYILATYKLIASDCILIDDQPENIEGARKHGMQGILLKGRNYKEVRALLHEQNVL